MGTTARQIGSAAAWSVTARVGRLVLGLASSVVVVRSLGSHDYGVLGLIRTLLMVAVMLSGLGLGQAMLKFVPAIRVGGTPGDARWLVGRVFAVNVAVWAILTAGCWLGRGWIEGLFGFDGLGILLAAAVALSLFESLFARLTQLLLAAYDARRLSIASLTCHVVYLALLVVLLGHGHGIGGVIVSAAAGYLVACLMVVGRVPRVLSFAATGQAGESVDSGRLMRYSLPMVAIGLLHVIVWRQSETVLLAHFRTASETGYFDLAYRMPQTMLEFIPGTVWPLVMAGISEVYSRDRENLRMAVDRYYRMLFLLSAPIGVGGMVLGGKMVEVMFGSEMMPAAVPTQVFFGIFTLSFLSAPLSMALLVMEKTHVYLLLYAVLAVVNVGLDLVLIPRFGVAGAIVPVGFVIAVQPLVYGAAVRRQAGNVRVPAAFIGRCFLASSPLLLLLPLTRFVGGVATLAAAALVAMAVVVVSFRMARVVGPAERDLLGSVPLPMADRLLKFISP